MAAPSTMGLQVQFPFLVVFVFVLTAAFFASVVVVALFSSWFPRGLVVVLTAPLEVGCGLSFQAGCPEVLLLFLGVLFPKGSRGGGDVAVFASGCQTAI